MSRITVITVLLTAGPATAEVNEEVSRRSIQSALRFVNSGGAEIEKGASCVNCHHSALRSWSLREAAEIGGKVDVAQLQKQTNDDVAKLVEKGKDYSSKQWDHSLSSFFMLAEGSDNDVGLSDEQFDSLARMIISRQEKEGSWKAAGQFSGQRRPKKDAHEVQTMWSVLALARFDTREEVTAVREKALAWLRQTEPGATIDSRVLRILVEQEYGSAEKTESLRTELLKSQNKDGGWGWQPNDPSEAWATGMVLYGLSRTEEDVPSDAIDRAMVFLSQTQKQDGSWLVEGKLKKNPEMASYFGTVWAIIGMSRTLAITNLNGQHPQP